ncbi:two-component system response regulator TorR [Shewanella corallii]|uniref:Two-component system response regulator TorR n=1 Tax=Shewanella corallii TaxID=560080 RepID=A0ABT0N690_9GAMM|nr:two-component system response regulator TorR [Shewanella corallii]MCL2913685.1 two-component system response regulator TorR [Shewanella corallii]
MYNILIFDTDCMLLPKLEKHLEPNRYRLIGVTDSEQLWYEFNRQHVDLVLLDVNQPSAEGLHITRELRARSNVGIVLISDRAEPIDRIIGLEMGADDYIGKPYELRELQVRLRNLMWRIALVRKAESAAAQQHIRQDNLIQFEDYELELNSRKLRKGTDLIKLTKAEFELLVVFALHPQQVLTRERLMQQTSHRNQDVNDRTIDVIIRRLRNKMSTDLFVTVHGEGYLFSASPQD